MKLTVLLASLVVCVGLVASTATRATGAVITVGQSGGYDYSTIQAAIGAAQEGDTIRVADGVYAAPHHDEIHMTAVESLTLEAENVGGAIIDGQGTGPIAVFIDNGDKIRGFWIRNVDYGIEQQSTGNQDPAAGAWIAERCIFSDAVHAVRVNDWGTRKGNGIVRNCTIYDMGHSGASTNDADTLVVLNTLIVNTATVGDAAVVEWNSNLLSIDYSNIYDSGQDYDNGSGGLLVGNNMHYVDPLFVGPDVGDFRLQPGSTMIDAGAVIPDLWGGYEGAAPDIGAYEVPEPATMLLLAAGGLGMLRGRRRTR